jgi:serine/threonine protein kinase
MGQNPHKYICKFYYDTEDKDFYYFVFEHCKGGSLSDLHLERGRLDE